jgi:hypothetical protein
MPSALSRRRVLGVGGALAASVVIGACSATGGEAGGSDPGGGGSATCVPRGSLESHRTLAGLPLVYEVTGRRPGFAFDGPFFTRLESWCAGLAAALPSPPRELSTYGSWTDGRSTCGSWHNAGRAFDVARLVLVDGSAVSCRYDQWRSLTGTRLAEARRRYWTLAAGLHQRFAYVLTYLDNAQHANHIHVDNGRSGGGCWTAWAWRTRWPPPAAGRASSAPRSSAAAAERDQGPALPGPRPGGRIFSPSSGPCVTRSHACFPTT